MNQLPTVFGNAEWIWSDDLKTVNQYVDFKTAFTLTANREVKLHISADSGYVARVNGVVLDSHQYPDYPQYKVFETVCITDFVRPGENLLEITGYCQNEDSFSYRKNIPGLIFSITEDGKTVCVSDEKTLCRSSVSFVSGDMDKFTSQLSYSFFCIADPEEAAWRQAVLTPRNANLYPCPIHPLRVLPRTDAKIQAYGAYRESEGAERWGDRVYTAWLSARPLNAPLLLPSSQGIRLCVNDGDGIYVLIDLGRETVGYFSLDIKVPRDVDMLFGFGEHSDDMRVRSSVGGRQFAAAVHLPAGRHSVTYRFKRLGCRYLQLHIPSKEATLYYAGLLPTEYPVVYREELPLRDEMHRRIAKTARRTLELCMHDHYEDCPWREQGLYGMDSMIQMMCGYVVFDNPEFAESSLRLLGLGSREDGLLELCAPARAPITIPAFALTWIMALRNYYNATGNTALIFEMRPVWEAVLEAFADRVDENGIVHRFPGAEYWNFYEWNKGLDGESGVADSASCADAPAQAFYIMALTAAEELAKALHDNQSSERFAKQKRRLIEAAELFWDQDRLAYVTTLGADSEPTYHELTQALMICANAVAPDRAKILCEKLTDPKSAGLVPVSLSCTIFKYMALLTDRSQYEEFILQNVSDVWGSMICNGATSFWETAYGGWDFDAAGSLCHGWSAVPLWVYGQLLK
ncbi:MAG: hypothetical protein J5874_03570 [Oscillospiraceae bacterium]|nr:hypothetical protein [Oscillospiraceae bacterium]